MRGETGEPDEMRFEPPRAEGTEEDAAREARSDEVAPLPTEYRAGEFAPPPKPDVRPQDWGESRVNIPVTRGPDPRTAPRPRGERGRVASRGWRPRKVSWYGLAGIAIGALLFWLGPGWGESSSTEVTGVETYDDSRPAVWILEDSADGAERSGQAPQTEMVDGMRVRTDYADAEPEMIVWHITNHENVERTYVVTRDGDEVERVEDSGYVVIEQSYEPGVWAVSYEEPGMWDCGVLFDDRHVAWLIEPDETGDSCVVDTALVLGE